MPKSSLHSVSNSGGADVLISHFAQIGIWQTITNSFEKRNARAEYTVGDCMQTWIMNMISGSKRLEHCYDLRKNMAAHPNFKKGMSPDTVSRIMRSLSVENAYYTKVSETTNYKDRTSKLVSNPTAADKVNSNEINYNHSLNCLTLDVGIALGLFVPGEAYELDIDATIIPTKVSDARVHFKQTGRGYAPMVVMLNGIPIFMEVRNGNSSASFRKQPILQEAIELFEDRGLKIKLVRIDAAGSSQLVLDYLAEKEIPFYIRAHSRTRGRIKHGQIWEKSNVHRYLEVSGGKILVGGNDVRHVDYRKKGDNKTWSIFTNDAETADENVIQIYNERARHENSFADLKEMGWHYMVHRELKYNSVHLHITMLAYVFFIYAKKWLAERHPQIKVTMKPKTFIRKFIRVVATWADGKLKFLDREKEFAALRGGT